MLDVRASGDVVRVGTRVRPRSQPGISVTDGGLVVSVAAPPEKGRATEEARRALAQALGLASSAVTLRSGATARRKVFEIRGMDAASVRALLLASA